MVSRARSGVDAGLLATVIVSLSSAGFAARASGGPAAGDFSPSGCIVLSQEAPEQQAPEQQAGGPDLIPEAFRLPPTERELREMARALARGEDTLARLLSKEALPSPSLRRIGVLVGDVRAVATVLDAQQALKRLDTIPNVPPATRRWMEAQVSTIRRCALRRFLARGGEPAFERTAALVGKLRGELDPVVFRARRPPGRPAEAVP